MKSVPKNSPAESSSSIPIVPSIPTSVRVWLWICLTAWAISFFLPAAKVNLGGGGRPALGWEIAYDALILLVVPVKGAYVGIFPALWTVFVNPFMLLVPWQIKRMERGEGRGFAMLFSIATAFPVVLAYLPPSLGLFGLAMPLLVGFYVWECSMIVAATLVMRTVWGESWGYIPAMVLSTLLLCLPIYRGEWNFTPEQSERASSTPSRSPHVVDTSKIQPTTIKLESSPNPSLNGEPVTFSTRVSVPRGSTPSGTVSITDGKETIYSMHTDGDVASVATNLLSIGEHSMQARFVADKSELYVGDTANLIQVVNDPRDRETRTVLSLTEQHPGRARTIGFSLRAKVTAEKTRTVAAPGSLILTSSGGWKIYLQLDENGEATLSSSIPEDRWKGYRLQAFYMGGKGFQASASHLILE